MPMARVEPNMTGRDHVVSQLETTKTMDNVKNDIHHNEKYINATMSVLLSGKDSSPNPLFDFQGNMFMPPPPPPSMPPHEKALNEIAPLLVSHDDDFEGVVKQAFPKLHRMKKSNVLLEIRQQRRGVITLLNEAIHHVDACIVEHVNKAYPGGGSTREEDPQFASMRKMTIKKLYGDAETHFQEYVRRLITQYVPRSLPSASTKTLKTWFINNVSNPYPNEDQKQQLSNETGLTITQINNWFINKRVRLWKPLVDRLKQEGLDHQGCLERMKKVLMHQRES
eukprot:CAMPEP_0117422812 /NCGR_PEP_ID=MMETSP0758-20121206/3581_1 /TAXON_ID=63605 /ORGANISM="Percolomonas cosmopolitus, Strain AE-1 (ATCC 50343)" /LENGTH=280 /DNA_ID=CAMNT_0005205665 /DNA_START=51 /DNA_END=893 /DNA_ORIENTATION=-